MSDEDAGAAARSEAARQVVGVIGMAVTVLVATWVERRSADPDAWRTLRMRGALAAERAAMRAARECARLADAARAVYERDRP